MTSQLASKFFSLSLRLSLESSRILCPTCEYNSSTIAFQRPAIKFSVAPCSDEELHGARFQVVHRAGHLDSAFGCQLREHRAIFPDVGQCQLNVPARHRVYKGVVARRALAGIGRRLHRRSDLAQQPGKITQLGVVDGAFDRATRGVPHHQHDFGTGKFARELHAAEDVFVCDVTRYPAIEDIPDA